MGKVELLAPAGDFNCLKAAVQNGANSVYFGISKFNARAFATNFSIEEMKEIIKYCKLRNVKTNLTLNALIRNSEFEDAVSLANEAYKAGIDAIIVQDLGLATFLIKNFPELAVHASTQMSIHNLEGALQAEKLGFKRVVLAREICANEIEYICNNTNVEIETFIHGALCISYSGQCLFSSAIGGRSGNRGRCAGPCRLPYSLVFKDNKSGIEKVHDKGYLLSPKDLCGINYIPKLIKAGVKCFKVEGRMKSPEYVAIVTRIYRKYIDLALSGKKYIVDPEDIHNLQQVYNRGGFSEGHLNSKANKNLIYKEKPNNMGLYLGNISSYNPNKGHITLTSKEEISIGDSIGVEKERTKYNISELMIKNSNVKNAEKGKLITIGRMKGNISVGDKVYKLTSKELFANAKNSYENKENIKIPLICNIVVKKNTPISINIFSSQNDVPDLYKKINISVVSDIIPIEALKTPISVERIIKQISKTNNTPYSFEKITVQLDDGLYVPSISTLNELRRKALEKLEYEISQKFLRQSTFNFKNNLIAVNKENTNFDVSLFLRVLNTDYDYTKLDKQNIKNIYLSLKLFLDKKYTNIIEYLSNNYNVYIYMPTIIKDNYKNIITNSFDDIIEKYNIKGFVISNLADFKYLEKYKNDYDFVGNYSLNIFNNYSVEKYSDLGLNTVTLSRELNKEAIQEIINNTNAKIELIVYGNLPIMATNYCFLGQTNNCYPECGTNCVKNNTYYLQDRLGYKFRIIPDNLQTVSLICNSKTLSISTKDLYINSARIDILDENIDTINSIVEHTIKREKLEGKDFTNGNFNREV